MKHTEVLPSLGETIEEGEVEEWMVEIGDEVENGEPILVVGTDKASLEINATASGVFTQKLVGVGDMVKVGAAVAEIESEG
jgi:pyruvate/2-oxoglutarate dehydrogenase complex dihydrolipoamide acyltransferase (E2) component|tara:strand:+ start:4887 stop:5129 length:243 start_codon:yes stop_codon:yes gene_type:complete